MMQSDNDRAIKAAKRVADGLNVGLDHSESVVAAAFRTFADELSQPADVPADQLDAIATWVDSFGELEWPAMVVGLSQALYDSGYRRD